MSKPFKIILSFVLLSCIILLTSCNANQSIQNPLSPDIPMLLDQAQKHTDLEDYEKAIAVYQEVIKADPDCYDAYMELANVFMLQHQKHEALNLLKQGILSMGGSADERSHPLLDVWWEVLLSSDETKELSESRIAKIEENMDLIYNLDCFYFAEEANKIKAIYMCDYFCYKFHERQIIEDNEVITTYPAEYVENDVVLFPDSSVKKLVSDILGLTQYDLKVYYTALKEEYPGELYAERLAEIAGEYSDFKKYMYREDIYCYLPRDDLPPAFYLENYKYLGDGMYYIVFSQGWTYDVDDPCMLEDMHIIIKESDSYFGFQVVALLQNDDESLIRPYWNTLE